MKNKNLFLFFGWIVLVILARFLKFSIPVGEQSATLVCFTVVLPVIGYFCSSWRSLSLVSGAWFLMHVMHPIPLTAGIPTLLATLSWRASGDRSASHWGMHLAFPLVAMAFFIFSSNGGGAWPYALYWLVPVACAFGRQNLFKRALQSTFVAHAAGSVMWAYFTPLSSAMWMDLIPVVAIERLLATFLAMGVIGILASLRVHRFAGKNEVVSELGASWGE